MLRPSLALLATLSLVFAACGGSGDGDDTSDTSASDESTSDETGGETAGDGDSGDGDGVDPNWPTQMAEEFCSTLYSCGCTDPAPPYADEADCVMQVGGFYQELVNVQTANGLSFDADCAPPLVLLAREHGCDTAHLDELPPPTCSFVHGDLGWAEQCVPYTLDTWFEQYSNCSSEFLCDLDPSSGNAFCLDREPVPYAGGEQCYLDPFTFECEDGFVCDWEQTENCNANPADGSPCISQQCSDTAWCNPAMGMGEGICVAKEADGGSCVRDEQCLSDNCVGNSCAPHPEAPILLCSLPKPGP